MTIGRARLPAEDAARVVSRIQPLEIKPSLARNAVADPKPSALAILVRVPEPALCRERRMATSVGLSRRSALINSIWRRDLDFIQANEDCPGAAQIVDDCRQRPPRRAHPAMPHHHPAIPL